MTEIKNIKATLQAMTTELRTRLEDYNTPPVMIGIHTGGVWLAEYLHSQLKFAEPLGTLDISFYRDDFSSKGMNPVVKKSELPYDLEDRHIILVDDIIHTGRTIRAAMNTLFDYGRPASIILVTLAERNGRELPIEPTVCGMHLILKAHQHIKLKGPDPLDLEVMTR